VVPDGGQSSAAIGEDASATGGGHSERTEREGEGHGDIDDEEADANEFFLLNVGYGLDSSHGDDLSSMRWRNDWLLA